MPYAIQIPFDGDWLYVTRLTETPADPVVQTYETREQAETAAQVWGENAVVVEIKDNEHE